MFVLLTLLICYLVICNDKYKMELIIKKKQEKHLALFVNMNGRWHKQQKVIVSVEPD